MSRAIKPDEPILHSDLHACIKLTVNQVDVSDIKERALAEGYREQTSRHITILSSSQIKEIKKHCFSDTKELHDQLLELLLKFDWKYEEKDLFHIEKSGYWDGSDILENRKSYIRTIEMPDMKNFYKELDKVFKINLPVKVPHITLFTKGERKNPKYYGIAVSSKEEFKKLKPVKIN